MHLKFLSAIAAAFLLAACQSTGAPGGGPTGGGKSASASVGGADVISQEYIVMNYGDRVFFDYDRYNLKPEGRTVVESWAAYAEAHTGTTFTIEGHADERGTREYNLALGNRRANATVEYLAALGVDADRLSIVSFGKERPAVMGSTESAYAQNRRSILVLN